MKTKRSNLPKGYVRKGNLELTGSDRLLPTRKLPNGATVIIVGTRRTDGAEAYDAQGRWLGVFRPVTAAEKAAMGGYCSVFQQAASELSAWLLWNDATQHSGTTVLEDTHGAQIIMIADDVYLRASKDEDGWTVEWLSREDIDLRYNTGEYLTLRHAAEPFVLQ